MCVFLPWFLVYLGCKRCRTTEQFDFLYVWFVHNSVHANCEFQMQKMYSLYFITPSLHPSIQFWRETDRFWCERNYVCCHNCHGAAQHTYNIRFAFVESSKSCTHHTYHRGALCHTYYLIGYVKSFSWLSLCWLLLSLMVIFFCKLKIAHSIHTNASRKTNHTPEIILKTQSFTVYANNMR